MGYGVPFDLVGFCCCYKFLIVVGWGCKSALSIGWVCFGWSGLSWFVVFGFVAFGYFIGFVAS